MYIEVQEKKGNLFFINFYFVNSALIIGQIFITHLSNKEILFFDYLKKKKHVGYINKLYHNTCLHCLKLLIFFSPLPSVCPTSVNVMTIVVGVIIGIVAVGLALLLIWKLITTIQDHRELAKFENERNKAQWNAVSKMSF